MVAGKVPLGWIHDSGSGERAENIMSADRIGCGVRMARSALY